MPKAALSLRKGFTSIAASKKEGPLLGMIVRKTPSEFFYKLRTNETKLNSFDKNPFMLSPSKHS